MNIRLWGLLAVLLIALGAMSFWMSKQPTKPERVELKMPNNLDEITNPKRAKTKIATMQPGRVVVLNTNRGMIEFVLFEKDCPKTTARIADLVQSGSYDGVTFKSAESWMIQTNSVAKQVSGIGIEVAKGLLFDEGSVGMARADDPNSNLSEFFIATKPAHHLDFRYTKFGRVISGMDVARKITVDDSIKTATIRPITDAEKKLLADFLAK